MSAEHISYDLENKVLTDINLPSELGLIKLQSGKVRERYITPDEKYLILITTDRVSAFDRVITTIPHKGQVLTKMSEFWFKETNDIVQNHLIAVPDPNVMVVKKLEPLPIEVIVRDYMTGSTSTSIWTMYKEGKRDMYNYKFREGYRKNEKLDKTIITPTTKAIFGNHDAPITPEEQVQFEVILDLINVAYEKSLMLFQRAREIAEERGYILVDSKFEFGTDERVKIMDELFTPDSSRFWLGKTYYKRFIFGQEPDISDKELLRLWLVNNGYKGEGQIPTVPVEVRMELSDVYVELCEQITSSGIEVSNEPIKDRIVRNIKKWLEENGN